MNKFFIGRLLSGNSTMRTRHIMKTTVLFLFLGIFFAQASVSYSQETAEKLSLRLKSVSVREVCREIERKSNYIFVFSDNVGAAANKEISVNINSETIEEILSHILSGTALSYKVLDKQIVVYRENAAGTANAAPQPASGMTPQQARITVKGKVTDQNGEAVIGANIVETEDKTNGTITDIDGNFTLRANRDATLLISYIGYISQSVKVEGREHLEIKLAEDAQALDEVVVTGIFTRRKEAFTGSASSYNAEELKAAGNSNVLQSLKTLDPSFAVLDNNLLGSDPNRLPDIEIRGKSSMLGLRDELDADPNQPLFILDGFESSLAAINNLDINRVESITILKDAASTAIYGSKAANGVVVVETVKPEAGRLQVSYNGNLNASVPDLTSYNLMNSQEKLEFERLAGRYTPANWSTANELEYNRIYNEKLKLIESGVNTYWLAEPLRVGVNQKHSLYAQGGEGNFLFGLGAGYNGISGVMKKSDREIVSGNIDLIYRVDKFQFSNKFSVNSTNTENPIVPFQSYAEANPYYKKYNEDGLAEKWLEINDFFRASNPLWNAGLNSRNVGKNLMLNNFFIAEYFPTNEWRFRARLGITYGNDNTERFYSRNDTRYENMEPLKKGQYFSTNTQTNQYEGEASATYAKLIGKNRINLVVGGNMYSHNSLTQGYQAEGFPEGNFSYPSFANGYPENGTPTYYESILRSLNGYLNAGYSFDDRYLMDISLRSSGSSVFGSTRKFNTTWSVGLGWNIHREQFVKENAEWIDLLKLRGSIGNPGNQSFDSAQKLLTYAFQYNSMNYFGLGAALSQVGNPDLEWQITVDKNIGLDLTILNKRLSLTADYYYKVTDPLLLKISTPLSSGTSNYMTNAGEQLSKGLTAQASYYIIQNFKERFTWLVRANLRTQKIQIDKIGNQLATLNASGRGANTTRYYDGADPNDIWAVQSVGIDPSNGKELFLDKDGNYTYDFSYDNEIIVGNTRPDYEGVLGTTLNHKGFSVSMNFRYQLGADVFNTALFNKVENISRNGLNRNQDRRALYERWKEPGDIVRFKNIASAVSTPLSSRFVQEENVFTLESVYVSYEFLDGWIKKAGLSSFKLHASMRDVFRASTIRAERGISYPFARNVEAGVSLNF